MVSDSRFWVLDSGLQVHGSDLRSWGLVFRPRVQGSGFRVQDSGFRVQGSGFRVQGSGFRAQGTYDGLLGKQVHAAQPQGVVRR